MSWTITALCAEYASKHIGQLATNVIRMVASLILLSLTMLIFTGFPLPLYADGKTWFWLSMSGFVGYCFGDFCLFNAYIHIGARLAQLLMTLAPPTAALASWLIFGETLTPLAILGMFITLLGISISVMSKGGGKKVSLNIPPRGILYGIGAGMGQGLGLVLSKLGMTYYQANIPVGCDGVLSIMPFTSTFIRAITGMLGFTLVMLASKKTHEVLQATHNHRAMLVMIGAVIFGPFVGVSLSLMATLYTNPGIAQTIMAMTPIFILWPSWYLYKQKVTLREILGAVISVVGVSLFFV